MFTTREAKGKKREHWERKRYTNEVNSMCTMHMY